MLIRAPWRKAFNPFFIPHQVATTSSSLLHLHPSSSTFLLLTTTRGFSNSGASNKKPRLVLNHSSAVEGLVPVLNRVKEQFDGRTNQLHAIVPGRLAVTRGKAHHFRVKISVSTPQGHKAIARRGKLAQEVFFTGAVGQEELQRALDQAVERES